MDNSEKQYFESKLKSLKNTIHTNICCLKEQNKSESDETQEILNTAFSEIKTLLEEIAAGGGGTGTGSSVGTSCENPSFTTLCELQQLLDKLDEIKIQINGDDVTINMNLDEIEALLTTTNSVLEELNTGISTTNTTLDQILQENQNIDSNTADILTILQQNNVQYNNVTQYLVDDSTPSLLISANTVHSISYKVLQGTVDISIGSTTLPYITGEADMEEATTLIVQDYEFTPQAGAVVKIKTIH